MTFVYIIIGLKNSLIKILNFYIDASIHVGLSAVCLFYLTGFFTGYQLPTNKGIFVFFSTIVAYNFVKYQHLYFKKSFREYTPKLNLILLISFILSLYCIYLFWGFSLREQILIITSCLITYGYTRSILLKTNPLRQLWGIKIYVVAFCWVLITVLFAYFETRFDYATLFLLILERFTLIILLLLLFDIIDLRHDPYILKTVPQQIGVSKTKKIATLLLGLFLLSDYLLLLKTNRLSAINLIYLTSYGILFYFYIRKTKKNKTKYYTLLWGESLPILLFVGYELISLLLN